MTKFVLLMVLCSGLAGNQCKVISTPTVCLIAIMIV